MKENSSAAGAGGASSAPAAEVVEEDGASSMGGSEGGGGGRGAVATDGVREGGEDVSILDFEGGRMSERDRCGGAGAADAEERGLKVWLQ